MAGSAAARRGHGRAGWAGEEDRRTDGEPGIVGCGAAAQRGGGRHDVFQREGGRAGRGVGGKSSATWSRPRWQTAPLDVEPGQTQHQGVHRFERGARGRGRLGEERAAAGELGRPGPVGEKAEMANADEAVGDDVEEEAAEELGRFELHHFHAIAVGVVLPAEAHAAVVQAEDPIVGERDAVSVAAEVLEDLLRAGEGAFRGEKPRRAMSRIMRVRSSLMGHLQGSTDKMGYVWREV